jgi:hypothetical protein
MKDYRALMRLFLLMILFVLEVVPVRDIHGNTSFEIFLSHPSKDTWEALKSDAKLGRLSSRYFEQILIYHEARLDRDFPNSMSLVGITPNEFVKLRREQVDSALSIIRSAQDKSLWRLLDGLALQDFDEDLVWTALEIAARLSQSKFEEIAQTLKRIHPDEAWIVERIVENWLTPRRQMENRPRQ